jgi:cytochrome c-type biogenesis protein CcmF
MYPLVLDILGLEKISVGVPYYNSVFLPLMIPLVFLAGYIPILFLSKKVKSQGQSKYFFISFIIIILVSLLSNSLFNVYNLSIFIGFFLFAWITLNLIYDFISKLISTGGIRFFFKNIGMFMAHLGLALFVIGATVVENNKIEKEVIMNLNEKLDVGGYSFEFVDINENMGPNYSSVIGHFRVYINNEFVTDMYPEKRLYNSSEMPMTEAGIDPGFKRDLYITLGTMIDQDKWSVRIYHKPLIRFIWIGALMMALGAILSVLMKRRNTKVVN